MKKIFLFSCILSIFLFGYFVDLGFSAKPYSIGTGIPNLGCSEGQVPKKANDGSWSCSENFTIDGSGNIYPTSITIPKTNNIAGTNFMYEANGLDVNGIGWKGPLTRSSDLYLQLPSENPITGQIMLFSTPVGDTSTISYINLNDRFVAVFDGGGSEIQDNKKIFIYVPFNCTITSVVTLVDQTGSISVDLWKDAYANYPPTDADSITAASQISISGSNKNEDSILTGWSKTLSAGDILCFNVDSATTVTWANITLNVVRR